MNKIVKGMPFILSAHADRIKMFNRLFRGKSRENAGAVGRG